MRYLALASDYDETLARQGSVSSTTVSALESFRSSGRKLILVTGRELEDLRSVCPRLDLFDVVIAENGALLYDVRSEKTALLAEPPPPEFAQELRRQGVSPLACGRVIVATLLPHLETVQMEIAKARLPLEMILNKDAIMILPQGINKASGLRVALSRLEIPSSCTWAVGDAENDLVLLREAGYSAAVANAISAVKKEALFVTSSEAGKGVEELIARILHEDN